MLARLGLRSGDVARLRLTDIDWNNGTLQVTGKGRYQVRLPLPQDVGDALLRYLECRPGNIDTDHVFIRSNAPRRSFASGDGVSSVVKHALKRANIDAPAKGAHLLRHTAATEMLRTGVPLDQATRHPRAFGAAKVSKPLSFTRIPRLYFPTRQRLPLPPQPTSHRTVLMLGTERTPSTPWQPAQIPRKIHAKNEPIFSPQLPRTKRSAS